jgi:hypothetical protein
MNADIAATKEIDLMGLIEPTTRLKKVSSHEYAGPCPRCGGTDRFRVDPTKGWWCRQCTGSPDSGGHWGDQLDFVRWLYDLDYSRGIMRLNGGKLNCTGEELERRVAERKALDDARLADEHAQMLAARAALQASSAQKDYAYNLRTYPHAADLWSERGLPAGWCEFYGVGYCPERDSLTIPYWRTNAKTGAYELIGLRHRLLGDTSTGKYRPEIAGLGNHLFYAQPMAGLFGTVLVVEGEIKAMVAYAHLWGIDPSGDPEPLLPNTFVVGVPGKSWKAEWIAELNQADRVIICLDPDARKEADRLAGSLSCQAKVISLPGKIDDLLLDGVIDSAFLVGLLS